MARQQAKEACSFEAIFVRAGEVIEGAVSNVMMVRSGVLVTAPADERILSGVTRAVVLDLARKEGIPVEERAIRFEELRGADEIFLTGTTVEILPVIGVDGVTVGTGRLGELTRLLSHRFRSSVE